MAALMAESPAEAWVTVFCQRTYNPYQAYGRRNPAFRGSPGLDGRLLDFKQRDARAIKSETAVLLAAVKQLDFDDAILVIIPGHEAAASNDGTPLACAAATIASATGFTAASDSLIRTTSIEKLAKGGNRSIEAHLNSMELWCFRHQLLLPRPYLVLTKPLRLDIQCQRGASVKIGWKYLDD